MEKGQLRCDVNISRAPEGQKELGAKIELKNLNSISAVRRAIHFEIERQTEDLETAARSSIQSTRRWDDDRGETTLMRTKEDAHDYRYFPDPDLLPDPHRGHSSSGCELASARAAAREMRPLRAATTA